VRRLLTWLVAVALAATALVASGGPGLAAGRNQQQRGGDGMDGDIATAVTVVDRFWATHWNEFFMGRYSKPAVFGGYSSKGRKAPYCGIKRVDLNNAHYCPAGDYIAWDVDFMRRGYRYGDSWVYQVVAHEWGHAVQRRLIRSLVWNAYELQADCLAGATLYGAAEDGILRFEKGDVDELATAYDRLGDRTPWTNTSDHGTTAQRLSAFNRGAGGGVRACLPR
jgi:predicted metalloprotease